jgi:hypothetical protein
MPKVPGHHIPAPESRAPSPGAAYCGARGPWHHSPAREMRRYVCETVAQGRARQFCPKCLSLMLSDSSSAQDAGRKGGFARRDRLTPEQRHAAAVRAAAMRWGKPSAGAE